MENNNSNQEELWMPCPKGMLRQVAKRSAERDHIQKRSGGQSQFDRRHLLKLAGAIVVTAGAGTIAYKSLSAPGMQAGYGGISCKTFLSNMDKYIQKGLEDQKLVGKMDEHKKYCKNCRARFDMKQNS